MKKKVPSMRRILEEKKHPKIASLEFLKPGKSVPLEHHEPRPRASQQPGPSPEASPGLQAVPDSYGPQQESLRASDDASRSAFSSLAVSFNHLAFPDRPDTQNPAPGSLSQESASLGFLMRQIERLQGANDLLQKRLTDLENQARLRGLEAPQKKPTKVEAQERSCSEVPVSPWVPESVLRDEPTGKPVCPRCIVEDKVAVIMKPRKIYISTVSDCPHCHKKSLTSQEEREPVTILPPEIQDESCRKEDGPPEDPQ